MSSPTQYLSRSSMLLVLILFCVPPAHAQPTPQLLWSFHGNGSLQAIVCTPDIDGDGGDDIAFEGYENGPTGANHVFAIRGNSSGTGQVLWSARPIGGVSSGGGWGDNCLRLGPDANGDGFPELLLGTAWGGRTAYALNGRTGATVWGYDTYAHYGSSYAGWIYAMDNLGTDMTGDGVPEVVFCSGSYNDRVHCVNGATGAQIWSYYGGDAFFDIRSCEDINNDGIRDVVASLGDNAISPRLIALSGANGAVIWQRALTATIWNFTFITDLNGDGTREVVPAQLSGNLVCLNGRNGAILWTSPIVAQQRVVTLDDVNGDGISDIGVGCYTTASCRVCSGANGLTLWSTPTSDWTWAIDRVADCTGDGISNVAVGDFDGKVYVMNGVTGAIFWSWLNPTGDKIMTIRGVSDLNHNGAPDIVAGTQLLYGGTGGDVYALEGNNNPTSVPDGRFVAGGIRLGDPVPNPSVGPMQWVLSSPRTESFRLLLFSSDGRKVRDLGERNVSAGADLPVVWDGRDDRGALVSGGVYQALLLQRGAVVAERKTVVVR